MPSLKFNSKKSPTVPTERTLKKPEYLIALAPYLWVRKVPFHFWLINSSPLKSYRIPKRKGSNSKHPFFRGKLRWKKLRGGYLLKPNPRKHARKHVHKPLHQDEQLQNLWRHVLWFAPQKYCILWVDNIIIGKMGIYPINTHYIRCIWGCFIPRGPPPFSPWYKDPCSVALTSTLEVKTSTWRIMEQQKRGGTNQGFGGWWFTHLVKL